MPNLTGEAGSNINGPSLIKAPAWLKKPLGKYYLYFAHHNGNHIRLAYSESLYGEWRIYEPGTLQLRQTDCYTHIASPDIHVDDDNRIIYMYFHGTWEGQGQVTYLARSKDGLNFETIAGPLGPFYFRVWQWDGAFYAIAKDKAGGGGLLMTSPDGMSEFEPIKPILPGMRHCAVRIAGDTLHVYYSRIGDKPEHILHSAMKMSGSAKSWKASKPVSLLKSEREYEGADLPVEPSKAGLSREAVNQLRDPGIYEEGGKTYLLYSVAGEKGIAIAELEDGE
ncbi:MAG: hypothetical protein JXR97_08610 [Planctomycetes bacterium]|nr:hypothetical protein [Planctomycetota bacterium]